MTTMKPTTTGNEHTTRRDGPGVRTISTVVSSETHRRMRTLSATLGIPNSEVLDRSLRLLELRVHAEQQLND